MNHYRLRHAFALFHYTLGLVVLLQSVATAVASAQGTSGAGRNPHLVVLASVEAVAAILFLVPRTVRLGGGVLLAVFAVAIGVHAMRGEFASTLFVYSAAVVFVMAHGPSVGVSGSAAPSEPPN